MSDSLKESLSALLDNEADELELRRVLKACEEQPELLQTWRRYSAVQAVLRDGAMPLGTGFAAGVALEIDGESPARVSGLSPWQRNLVRLAVAASVAVVFFFVLQVGLTPSGRTPQVAESGMPEPAPPVRALAAAAPGQGDVQQIAPRVKAYIEAIYIDIGEPPHTEHLQNSPLYRLVNELAAQPQ